MDVCQLLQPVLEEMADEFCEVWTAHSNSLTHLCMSLYYCSHMIVIVFSSFVQQLSPSEQSVLSRRSFCFFVGKLFLDASYSRNRE